MSDVIDVVSAILQGIYTATYNQSFRPGDIVGFNDSTLRVYAVGKVLQVNVPDWTGSGYQGFTYVVSVPDGRVFNQIPDPALNLIRHEMSA